MKVTVYFSPAKELTTGTTLQHSPAPEAEPAPTAVPIQVFARPKLENLDNLAAAIVPPHQAAGRVSWRHGGLNE